jgi:hypothetical protein
MTKASRQWNQSLWAVRFTGSEGDSFLLGTRWHRVANEVNKGYPGEPPRALLFTTRQFARGFCVLQRAMSKKTGGICAQWKFTPVRVRERVIAT